MVLSSQWRNAKSELDQLRRSLPPVGPELELWNRHKEDPCLWIEDLHLLPGLDPWQKDALRSNARQAIWLINRQGGKSSIAALIALHRAILSPGSLILMVSRSIRQSGELFRKFEHFYSMLDSPPPKIKSTELSCELYNRSRVVSLPDSEDTIRGFSSVDLLIEDESSRVSDALYFALRPMLAVSQGRLLLLGTPRGKLGHFYEVWKTDSNLWEKVLIDVESCPRISKSFLESERQSMPESWFLQEYYCQFQDTIDQVFNSDLVDSLFSDEIVPLFPTNRNQAFGKVTNQTTESDSLISDKIKPLEEEIDARE